MSPGGWPGWSAAPPWEAAPAAAGPARARLSAYLLLSGKQLGPARPAVSAVGVDFGGADVSTPF